MRSSLLLWIAPGNVAGGFLLAKLHNYMQVTFIQNLGTVGQSFRAGETNEIPDYEAEVLISTGVAKAAAVEKVIADKKTATVKADKVVTSIKADRPTSERV